ncbi:hypothetical protein ACSX1A_11690 [Pontibacter sp. MBLB2868]|uniref:hypothetical protein n=1 Tax=Pontibacter sp. MBLB2868 TaxID=3451555 RepID=UPI003F74F733
MHTFTLGRCWRAVFQPVLFWALLLLIVSACTRRESFPQDSEEPVEQIEGEAAPMKYDGVLLAQVVSDSVHYIVSKEVLLQPFIREFGDGTVVDKVMIRKVQEVEEDTAAYYLVGLGMRNGAFRSMALELDIASDNSLYLSSQGDKHMCQASIGCSFCYFTYSGNKITGCECGSRSIENKCVHKVSQTNGLLRNTRVGAMR